jgi:hypothetical protein
MFLQFFNPNNSGAPASGYLLFTYKAGTTTKQATWTDSTQTVENSNPLSLDSNGCAAVWGDPALSYKFVLASPNDTDPPTSPLRTSNGIEFPLTLSSFQGTDIGEAIAALLVPITDNPIIASLKPTAAEISAGISPTNFTYPPLNVLRYGADPTGAISSLTAFNSAYSVAMQMSPHGHIYAPSGTYLIPSPGLSWTNQKDIYFEGDGFASTILQGDSSNAYTVLTISADTGAGTTGLNLVVGNFAIKSGNFSNQHCLLLADYLYAQISNLELMSAGNPLTMRGMAQFTCTNVYCLSWQSNTSANFGLKLIPDTDGIGNDGLFNGCWFQGSGNATGAVFSQGTLATVFNSCTATAQGPNLNAVVQHNANDDVTWIEFYSEESYGAANNTGVMFQLQSSILSFRLIGGLINCGNAANTIFLAKGIQSTTSGTVQVIGTQFNNFGTCAISYTTPASFFLNVQNVYASGGAEKVIDPSIGGASPTGIYVQNWIAPGQFGSSVSSSPFVVNSGTAVNTASTFDGYTLAQVVKSLRLAGLLV